MPNFREAWLEATNRDFTGAETCLLDPARFSLFFTAVCIGSNSEERPFAPLLASGDTLSGIANL